LLGSARNLVFSGFSTNFMCSWCDQHFNDNLDAIKFATHTYSVEEILNVTQMSLKWKIKKKALWGLKKVQIAKENRTWTWSEICCSFYFYTFMSKSFSDRLTKHANFACSPERRSMICGLNSGTTLIVCIFLTEVVRVNNKNERK
jgi:hypothetical protein